MVALCQRQGLVQMMCGFLLPPLGQAQHTQPMRRIGGIPELAGRANEGCRTRKIGARSLPLPEGESIEATPIQQVRHLCWIAKTFVERNRLLPGGTRLLKVAHTFISS